jgi:formylglycine-generating enzyme required for sulfatase activity
LEPVYYITGIDWETLEFVNIPTTNSDAWNAVEPNWNANGFRLATEAEREFAARAGTTTEWSFGDDPADFGDYAWDGENSRMTRQVGLKRSNPWGLYDMHGNVWEWDRWYIFAADPAIDPTGPGAGAGDFRVFRGGCWDFPSVYTRSAIRNANAPNNSLHNVGFRVVRR